MRRRSWAAPAAGASAFRPDVGRQHLRHELRLAVGERDRGASTAGAAAAGCLHNTGEGGLSPHHRHGGELVFQIGTAYFGCRDEQGRFSLARLKELVESAPVRALEIKLSQGAKPGLGGVLPAREGVAGDRRDPRRAGGRGLPEPVAARGVRRRRLDARLRRAARRRRPDCRSGSSPRSATSASGTSSPTLMADGERGRRLRHHRRRRGRHRRRAADLHRRRLAAVPARLRPGVRRRSPRAACTRTSRSSAPASSACPTTRSSPSRSAADLVNVGREAMLAVGCIQAQKCHTGDCPTGVATQNQWLARGLDPSPSPNASPTTSRPCGGTCSRSPRPAGSSTRR